VIIVVASLVVGLFLVRRLWLGYPPTPHSVLGRGEAAFAAAAAETIFPAGAGLPLDGRAADLPGYADEYLRALPPRQRGLIRALFVLFEQGPLIFPARGVGAFRRFSSMNPEQRTTYLEGWSKSRLSLRRKALDALKAVLILGYVGRRENLAALGLTPFEIEPVRCEADLLYPAIGRPRSSIRWTAADLNDDAPRVPLRRAVGPDGSGPVGIGRGEGA